MRRYEVQTGHPGNLKIVGRDDNIHAASNLAESVHRNNSVSLTQVWDTLKQRIADEQISKDNMQQCRWQRVSN